MPLFKIAEIYMNIIFDNKVVYTNLSDYNDTTDEYPDLVVVIRGIPKTTSSNKDRGYGEVMTWYVSPDKSLTIILQSDDASQLLARMELSSMLPPSSKMGKEFYFQHQAEPEKRLRLIYGKNI